MSEIREFEIWSEGYAATGERATAFRIGVGRGADFAAAVKDWYSTIPDAQKRYGILDTRNGRPALWRCKLFDNERDARKSFG